jgi:hypothetical protein
VAHFYDYGIAKGYWFTFALKYASDPDFRVEYEKELLDLITEEGSFRVYGKNGQIKKGVPMRVVRR